LLHLHLHFPEYHSDSRNHKKTRIFQILFHIYYVYTYLQSADKLCVPLFLISGSYCLSGCRSLRPAEYSFLYLSYLNFVTHEHVDGTFIGYLPIDRIGEFQKKESHEIIKIKVSKDLADSDVINQHLNALSKISITVTTVGKSKPKYTLEKIPDWNISVVS
jgi:hypothetical protein